MTPSKDGIPEEMQSLREDYLKALPGKIDRIESLHKAIREDRSNQETFQDFTHQAHKLAGSAALYGLADLSTAAKELEVELTRLPSEEFPLTQELKANLGNLFTQLMASIPEKK